MIFYGNGIPFSGIISRYDIYHHVLCGKNLNRYFCTGMN
jgi:hypothetical protein